MARGGRRTRSGPPPKPTALRAIEGNPSHKRRAPGDEPAPPSGRPPQPPHLRPEAARVWGDLCQVLEGMGVLTLADGVALEMLCEAYADWRDARDQIEIHGLTQVRWMVDPEGHMVVGGIAPRPEVAMADKAWRRFHAMVAEFGLTPSSRTRVRAEKPAEVDPLEALLAKRRGA